MIKSPFKLLRSYEKEDIALYFGRELEIEALYNMTFESRFILLTGLSGTGKSSLVKCGLANKFPDTKWEAILIRRVNNFNDSLLSELNARIKKFSTEEKDYSSPYEAIERLNRLCYKPIYLIFDQFEELFTEDLLDDKESKKEGELFFEALAELFNGPIPCKIIIVMREEYIVNLWDFEYILPNLLHHKIRLTNIKDEKLENTVKNLLVALRDTEDIQLIDEEKVAQIVREKLEEKDLGLPYLQIFLDRIYKREHGNSFPSKFSPITANIKIDEIIEDFLTEQLSISEGKFNIENHGKDLPIKLLGKLISSTKTKKVLPMSEFIEYCKSQGLMNQEITNWLAALEDMRIINTY